MLKSKYHTIIINFIIGIIKEMFWKHFLSNF
nr:MAG TPA: hypothetical protein [Caudoviricetes sp.]